MSAITLLFLALITQETIFTHVAISQARNTQIAWINIHLIWLIATLIHLVVPYFIGKYLLKKSRNSKEGKFHKFTEKLRKTFPHLNKDSNVLLFVLGIFNFVYINSFLLAIFKINSLKAFTLIFFGDLIWYLLVISLNLSGLNALKNLQTLGLVIVICLAFGALGEKLMKKFGKK